MDVILQQDVENLGTIGEVVKVRVVDRTQLILDIFAQRAHTRLRSHRQSKTPRDFAECS